MKIFIDFDDVIFNTKQFKENLAGIFFKHGVTSELYEATYYDPNDNRTVRTYDPFIQIQRLKANADFNEKKVSRDVESLLANADVYVFNDVALFADKFGRENVFVLSYGDIDFQNKKIDNSGIRINIPGIFVTDTLKADMLDRALETILVSKGEPVYFLDDRVEQIADVKEKFPNIITILVKRPEGRYQEMVKEECCNHEAHDLNEARKIIESQS